MMKEVVRSIDPGLLPEIGLIAFLLAFVLVLIRVFLMPRQEREAAKQIPLHDDDEFYLQANHE